MEERYLYENHMGGIFTSNEELDYNETHCSQCGDSDWLIGSYSSIKEFWDLIKENCDIDGLGGWSLQYLYPNMVIEFEDVFEKLGVRVKDLDLDYEGWCELGQDEILDSINAAINIDKREEKINEQ